MESPQSMQYHLSYRDITKASPQASSIEVVNHYMNQPELLQFTIPTKRIDHLQMQIKKSEPNGEVTIRAGKVNGKEVILSNVLMNKTAAGDVAIEKNKQTESTSSIFIGEPETVYAAQRHYQWLPLLSIFVISVIIVWSVLFIYFPRFYRGGRTESKLQRCLFFCALLR